MNILSVTNRFVSSLSREQLKTIGWSGVTDLALVIVVIIWAYAALPNILKKHGLDIAIVMIMLLYCGLKFLLFVAGINRNAPYRKLFLYSSIPVVLVVGYILIQVLINSGEPINVRPLTSSIIGTEDRAELIPPDLNEFQQHTYIHGAKDEIDMSLMPPDLDEFQDSVYASLSASQHDIDATLIPPDLDEFTEVAYIPDTEFLDTTISITVGDMIIGAEYDNGWENHIADTSITAYYADDAIDNSNTAGEDETSSLHTFIQADPVTVVDDIINLPHISTDNEVVPVVPTKDEQVIIDTPAPDNEDDTDVPVDDTSDDEPTAVPADDDTDIPVDDSPDDEPTDVPTDDDKIGNPGRGNDNGRGAAGEEPPGQENR